MNDWATAIHRALNVAMLKYGAKVKVRVELGGTAWAQVVDEFNNRRFPTEEQHKHMYPESLQFAYANWKVPITVAPIKEPRVVISHPLYDDSYEVIHAPV